MNFFDKIYIEDGINLFITMDSIYEVKIEAGKNLISLISTEVSDNELKIKNKNKCNWVRSYKKEINVYVKMPSIKYITSDGMGSIKSLDTIRTDFTVKSINSGDIDLMVNNNNILSVTHVSADITLRGKTINHTCITDGTGFIRCENLQTDQTWIWSNIHNIGNAYVNVKTIFTVKINGKGDIYYSGNPATVEKIIDGPGHVYQQ